MATRPVTEKRVVYELKDNWFADSLTKNPKQARKIFSDNIYQRCLSLLMVKAVNRLEPLAAEKNGIIRSLGAERAIDKNHAESFTVTSTGSHTVDDGWRTLRVDIMVSNHDMLFAPLDADDHEWDSIKVPAGCFFSFDFYGNGVKAYNLASDGSHNGTAYVVLWGSSQIQGAP